MNLDLTKGLTGYLNTAILSIPLFIAGLVRIAQKGQKIMGVRKQEKTHKIKCCHNIGN